MSSIHDELTTADPAVSPLEEYDPLAERAAEFNERIRSKFGTPTEREVVQPQKLDGWDWAKPERIHLHHFTYQLNAGNTALRGCSCGLAFASLLMGEPDTLAWHPIYEVPEGGE